MSDPLATNAQSGPIPPGFVYIQERLSTDEETIGTIIDTLEAITDRLEVVELAHAEE